MALCTDAIMKHRIFARLNRDKTSNRHISQPLDVGIGASKAQ
jgi:hypothetical protein